jgi:hypothetical protein
MYFGFLTREQLLELLPKGGEVAEIGVAEGEFSEVILAACQPRKLHLIDPWEFQDRQDYVVDPNNVDQNSNDARYKNILQKFAPEIASGQVEVHRKFSQDAAADFKNEQFDWIYIDAMHTYEAVTQDLESFMPKVKSHGLILGHDYADHINSRKMNFGVVPAVNDFVFKHRWQFLLLTNEVYPTYLLAQPHDQITDNLVRSIVFQAGGIRFADFPSKGQFTQFVMGDGKGTHRAFPEFRLG